MQAVKTAVSRVISRSVKVDHQSSISDHLIAQKILVEIKKDLKSLNLPEAKHVDVEIEVNTDFGDFYVAGLPIDHHAA